VLAFRYAALLFGLHLKRLHRSAQLLLVPVVAISSQKKPTTCSAERVGQNGLRTFLVAWVRISGVVPPEAGW
jgi:hypothetical protein